MSDDSGPSISMESNDSQPSNTDGSHGSLANNIEGSHGSQPAQPTKQRRKRSVTLLKKHKKDPNLRLGSMNMGRSLENMNEYSVVG